MRHTPEHSGLQVTALHQGIGAGIKNIDGEHLLLTRADSGVRAFPASQWIEDTHAKQYYCAARVQKAV